MSTNDATLKSSGLMKGLVSHRSSQMNLLNSQRSPREDYQGFNLVSNTKKIHDRINLGDNPFRSDSVTPMKMRSYSTLSQTAANTIIPNDSPYINNTTNIMDSRNMANHNRTISHTPAPEGVTRGNSLP